ncbi:hypothetical protein C265_29465 [Cupriavidus sp. GA3-3]|uniref:Uncharacterized protein n=1 Tax=Cupriavidus necator (strain ATCC 17699 / DSM 428 / KCTC 22496 / NCIMB 10442 / H16 / Stanier 337) TaxID=381666 RepID=Q0K8Q3_CUPNH|nr:hypothetical protein C265_29465 [Cupriavidus sp. GA3-3]CAJ93618.1 Hypothetical protein H16_A2531 [Cupriavidus necator H16]
MRDGGAATGAPPRLQFLPMLARFGTDRACLCATGTGNCGLGHRSAAKCQSAPARMHRCITSRNAAWTCRYNVPGQKIPVATHKLQKIRIIIVYTSPLTRCPRVALPRQPS